MCATFSQLENKRGKLPGAFMYLAKRRKIKGVRKKKKGKDKN